MGFPEREAMDWKASQDYLSRWVRVLVLLYSFINIIGLPYQDGLLY